MSEAGKKKQKNVKSLPSATRTKKTVQSKMQGEDERKKIEHALRERVKELGCLYGIAKLDGAP